VLARAQSNFICASRFLTSNVIQTSTNGPNRSALLCLELFASCATFTFSTFTMRILAFLMLLCFVAFVGGAISGRRPKMIRSVEDNAVAEPPPPVIYYQQPQQYYYSYPA
jgi:hypothetical protein